MKLRAAVPAGPGIAVNCGTGLAIGARGCSGKTWHGSFWLESHGAREMARSAFGAAVRAELGYRPPDVERLIATGAVGRTEWAKS